MKIFTEQAMPMPVLHDKHQTYDANTPMRAWFEKIEEEVLEAHEQAVFLEIFSNEDSRKALAYELTDIKTVCETFLNALGYDASARADIQCEVNEKNSKRGYLKPIEKGGEGR